MNSKDFSWRPTLSTRLFPFLAFKSHCVLRPSVSRRGQAVGPWVFYALCLFPAFGWRISSTHIWSDWTDTQTFDIPPVSCLPLWICCCLSSCGTVVRVWFFFLLSHLVPSYFHTHVFYSYFWGFHGDCILHPKMKTLRSEFIPTWRQVHTKSWLLYSSCLPCLVTGISKWHGYTSGVHKQVSDLFVRSSHTGGVTNQVTRLVAAHSPGRITCDPPHSRRSLSSALPLIWRCLHRTIICLSLGICSLEMSEFPLILGDSL